MVIGGVVAAVMTVVYLEQAGHHPSYYTLAVILALGAFFLGVAYTPWMASFTETVEHHNPALTATGLAIWSWIIRVVVFIAFLLSIPLLRGRWKPSDARRDEAEHEELVAAELAKLGV